jgi:Skp family chaperone for outer membrane proteins
MKQNRIRTLFLSVSLLSSGFAASQITPVNPAPVPYASVSELNGLLANLEQASQTTQTDLGRLRVEKWKMDSSYKKETLGNVDSVKRNLQSALPEIMTQLRNSPEDLGASFKLYRNLDALYDVLSTVAESAGAFGSKDEFQSLSNDLNAFERSRRAFAERMENLSNAKEAELAQLRTQVKTLQAAATPPPAPKKIIVDDNAPPKPAPKKKKPVPKPPSASNSSTNPPNTTAPPANQTKPQ